MTARASMPKVLIIVDIVQTLYMPGIICGLRNTVYLRTLCVVIITQDSTFLFHHNIFPPSYINLKDFGFVN